MRKVKSESTIFRAGRSARSSSSTKSRVSSRAASFSGFVQFVVVVERGRGRGVVDLAQVQPIVGERLDEAPGFRVVQEPLGLRAQDFGAAQLAALGERAQRVVRLGVPKEIGQPRGQGAVIETTGRFLDEEETRRRQDRRVSREHGFGKAEPRLVLLW